MSCQLVVLGGSLGGMRALQAILAGLPRDWAIPLAVVLHRGKDSDTTLPDHLQKSTELVVQEAEDKMEIAPGHLYLAPPDYHLMIEDGHLALSTDAPVNYARPSIDVLFESAADAYAERVAGIVLTGANRDGASGLAAITARGGFTIVQDPENAEAREMPEAAIAATRVDQVLPLEQIASFLATTCG